MNIFQKTLAACMGLVSTRAAASYRQKCLAYAAGRRSGPNGAWRPKDGPVDLLIARDNKTVQARARALVRDSPNLCGAIRRITNNVVFLGIRPQVQLRGLDGKRDRIANKMIEEDFKAWAEAVEFYDLQTLALRHLWIDGGYLLNMAIDKSFWAHEGLVPLRPELIDINDLDRSVHGQLPNGNIALWGQEFNSQRRPVAYHIRRMISPFLMSHETVRLSAETCKLVMVKERIGQSQPMSWLASVIMTMHDFDEYQSSERIAARLGAAFGVFVKLPANDYGGNDLNGQPLGGTLGTLAGGRSTDGRLIRPEKFISSGRIDTLPAGADIAVAKNERPSSSYEPYNKTTLRNASTGIGMSAEAFSNDYSDASYSSARSASLEERRGYKVQQNELNTKHNNFIWRHWCVLRAEFLGGGPKIPVNWQNPGWQWVDPTKDATAVEKRLQLGLTTRRLSCAEVGLDFDEVMEELAEERAAMLALGLNPEPWATNTQATPEPEAEPSSEPKSKEE
ncbi:MAG: phage portal protein [Pseudomonadota bacterium]